MSLIREVENNNIRKVRMLLDNHVNPNVLGGTMRWSPLGAATLYNNKNMVQLLLDHGADPNMQDRSLQTPLFHASANDHLDIAQLLLDHGADPNIRDRIGGTALMEASANNYHSIVRLLLDHGADPNIRDKHGDTALSLGDPITRQIINSYNSRSRSLYSIPNRSREYLSPKLHDIDIRFSI